MRVLGIETSCDETGASVVEADLAASPRGRVLSDVVRSQIELHAKHGGVVPELASRDHAKAVGPVVREALAIAGVKLEELDAIAATCRPGLSGALLVGLQTAKGLAWSTDVPLVGVDHLVGHLLAVFLDRGENTSASLPEFPFLGLLVSGGHTALYRVDGPEAARITELGATRDDAAGEAFDKVGKALGLGYPGGPVIDKLAAQGVAARAKEAGLDELPTETLPGSLESSFSGLKSALARHVEKHGRPEGQPLADVCAAFQASVVSTLVRKTARAAEQQGLSRVVLAGGVAANRGLRAAMQAACAKRGFTLHVPDFKSCTDNAAMIAYAGLVKRAAGVVDGAQLTPNTRTELARSTRKGRGVR